MGLRTLRKTSEFLTQAQQASQSAPRLLEAIGGAEFVLVRTPGLGMAVRDSNLCSWPVHPASASTYKILYSFNDREVVFRALYLAVAPSL